MSVRSMIVMVVVLAVSVSVHAGEKEQAKDKPAVARGNVVGEVVCGKCEFDATETCSTAVKLSEKQFVLVAGKAAESLFDARESGKLVRVSGALTLKDGVLTITSKKSSEVKNQKAKPRLALAGKLVCTKCEFKIGEDCGVGLKSGGLQIALDGDAAKELFKDRCSGKPKLATGALTKIDGNVIFLQASKITDRKAADGNKKKTDAAKKTEET